MALIKYPDPSLLQKARDVRPTENLDINLVGELLYWLNYGAMGIAAPQLGFPIRVIGFNWGDEQFIMKNPRLVSISEKTFRLEERCMSFPEGEGYITRRSKIIKVSGTLWNGEHRSFKAHDLGAALFQHEIDHLDGILINQRGRKKGYDG